jgi:4a-hydroxytetrahydrobiopterin dehydratase
MGASTITPNPTGTARGADRMTLPEDEIRRRLPELDGWDYDGKQLVRMFMWPSFADAISFVDRLAVAADAASHHPSIDIRYDAVKLELSTHSEHGITEKDFALAKEINRAAAAR